MPRFLDPLITEDVDNVRARLVQPLRYETQVVPLVITVPTGFVTDFSSVPRIPLAYLLVGGKARRAAVIHDWLYLGHGRPDGIIQGGEAVFPDQTALTRAECDAVFFEAVQLTHGTKDAWIMWTGVRLGGWWRWGQ